MIVKQYEVGNFAVFCYLIGDEETQEGLFIDPADDAREASRRSEISWIK